MPTQAQTDMSAFTAGMAGFPGFNFEGLNTLIEDTNEEAALKVIARFRVTVETGLKDIEAAQASGNAEVVWKTAHKLAGTAELVGFDDFGRESKALSHTLKDDPDLGSHPAALSLYLDHCRKLFSRLSGLGCLAPYA